MILFSPAYSWRGWSWAKRGTDDLSLIPTRDNSLVHPLPLALDTGQPMVYNNHDELLRSEVSCDSDWKS